MIDFTLSSGTDGVGRRPGAVIVGAGQAGFETASALRRQGFDGKVTLVGEESELPYQRPPLSKELLLGSTPAGGLWFRPADFFAEQEIELLTGERVESIDRERRVVCLASGSELPYEHLVLATGARNRPLPVPGGDLDGVLSLRTVADANVLGERLQDAEAVVIVGAGFIGLEVAAAVAAKGAAATVLEILPRAMARAVSEPIALFCADRHRGWGSELVFDDGIAEIRGENGRVREVETSSGRRLPADLVLAGIGVIPNSELAEACGLPAENGILVDGQLRTVDPAISAIGDCCRFPSGTGASTYRLESVQNAVDQARFVAARIAGAEAADDYFAVPWFWSNQHDLRLQMVGITADHDEAVLRGDPAGGSFSVFCFDGGLLLGAESVNAAGDHMATRFLLNAGAAATLSPEQVGDDAFDLRAHAKASAS